MKSSKILFTMLFCAVNTMLMFSQPEEIIPDLSTINNPELWTAFNRKVSYDKTFQGIYLNDKKNDGLVWLNGLNFKNGTINVDIKGKDVFQKSFLGIAFHGLNDSTYDVIYFRPFNFKNPDTARQGHSVQYISHPQNTWFVLRRDHPEEYENPVNPVPDPYDWFHATLEIHFPVVKVFINNSQEPSLVVNQLSDRKEGRVGFWVGYGSDGSFRNLRIKAE